MTWEMGTDSRLSEQNNVVVVSKGKVRRVVPRASYHHGNLRNALIEEAVLYAPSWTLRGGTREILRGIIARGLGLR